jgi:hypothetical protein
MFHVQVSDPTLQMPRLQQVIQNQWHPELQLHARDQSHHPKTKFKELLS